MAANGQKKFHTGSCEIQNAEREGIGRNSQLTYSQYDNSSDSFQSHLVANTFAQLIEYYQV